MADRMGPLFRIGEDEMCVDDSVRRHKLGVGIDITGTTAPMNFRHPFSAYHEA